MTNIWMQLLHMRCRPTVCYERLSSEDVRHAQHTRYINIHKLHPLPEKIGLGRSTDFLHSGTGYVENSRVRSVIDFFCWFHSEFFRTSTARPEKFNHDFSRDFLHSMEYPFYADVCHSANIRCKCYCETQVENSGRRTSGTTFYCKRTANVTK